MNSTQIRDRYESIKKRNFRSALIHMLESEYKMLGSRKILEMLADDIEDLHRECYPSVDRVGFGEIVFRTTKDDGQRQSYGKKVEDYGSVTVILPLITKEDIERRIYYKKGDRNSNYEHREARDIETMVRLIKSTKAQGESSGVENVYLHYQLESDATWHEQEMFTSGDSVYKTTFPPFDQNDIFSFYISAADVEGGIRTSATISLIVFKQSHETLLVFNGFEDLNGFPQDYYFGHDDGIIEFDHDIWSFGELTTELINAYINIIEITTNGPNENNDNVIRDWLETDGSRNYMLAGDEYLNGLSGWPGGFTTPYMPGMFQYDVLGIEVAHNNIDLYGPSIASPVRPVKSSFLGAPMYQLLGDFNINIDSVFYNPYYQIDKSNWLGALEITEDSKSFMETDSGNTVLSIGLSRTLPAGNKIAFFAYDPLSIHSGKNEDSPIYNWLGFSKHAPQVQVLNWFGIVTNIHDKNISQTPEEFTLKQNYPNPFNNSTMINYQLSMNSDVKLVVYDALGRRIKTLVDTYQHAGEYNISFDASGFASGVYYYKLTSRPSKSSGLQYSQIRKMLLIK